MGAGPILGNPKEQFMTNAGEVAASYRLFTYAPGTSTKKDTYPTYDDADAATNANTNPVVLDSNGEPPNGYWGIAGEGYKVVLAPPGVDDPPGSTEWTQDDIFVADDMGLRTDLASTTTGKGAALVGYKQEGTGTVARTVETKLDDIYNAADFGVDDTGGTDTTAEFQAAIDAISAAGGGTLIVNAGTYLVLDIQAKSNVHIKCDPGATFQKNGGTDETHIIYGYGSVGTATALTADGAIGDTTVAVTSAASISDGDWVIIRSDEYVSGSSGRNVMINKITDISGLTVTLEMPLIAGFTTANNSELAPLTEIDNFHISGADIFIPEVAGGDVGGGVDLQYAVNCSIKDSTIRGMGGDAGVRLKNCHNCLVSGNTFKDGQNLSASGYGYGVELDEAVQFSRVVGNHSTNIRENTFTNRTRHCEYTGNVMAGHYDTGFNTHGANCSNILIADNIVDGTLNSHGLAVGFSTHTGEDTDVLIIGNVVSNTAVHGISVAGKSGEENKRISVIGNIVKNCGVTTASSNCVFYSFSDEGVIRDNTVEGVSSNVNYGMLASNADNVVIQDNLVANVPSGFGIGWSNVNDVTIRNNVLRDISSSNVRAVGTNTNVIIQGNFADDTTVSFDGNSYTSGNSWNNWIIDETTGGDSVSLSAASTGTTTVSFNKNFTAAPVFIPAVEDTVGNWAVSYSSVTTTGATIRITDVGGTSRTGTVPVSWIAIGK